MKRSLVICLCAALGGCGDDDGAPSADGGGPDGPPAADAAPPDAAPRATIDDVCDPVDGLYVSLVQKLLACHPEYQVFLGDIPTGAELAMACDGSLQPYLDDGTVELGDLAAFDACRTYIEQSSCATLEFDAPNPCDAVLVGTIAAGELCDSDDQCGGDSYCDRSGPTTCGSCAARKADGAACSDGSECQGGRCSEAGVCRAFGAVGDACDTRDDCLGDLRCDAAGLCAADPAWAVGTPCVDFLDCDPFTSDLVCSPFTNTCQQYREIGQSCGPGQGLCRIFEWQGCPAGTCVAPTIVNDGETCGLFEGRKCLDGSRCVDDDLDPNTPDVCVRVAGIGDPCDPDNSMCDFLLECVGGACQYGTHTGMCPAP